MNPYQPEPPLTKNNMSTDTAEQYCSVHSDIYTLQSTYILTCKPILMTFHDVVPRYSVRFSGTEHLWTNLISFMTTWQTLANIGKQYLTGNEIFLLDKNV
ncbi:hypothetical protein XENOCAPTIV_003908 [Xenoophorus captivus]|uniref:Uncharacterized protein n=1 Tax=Xenoophorus captivus TaxID=1517983 RepID=A0ABV0QPS8_9TELE